MEAVAQTRSPSASAPVELAHPVNLARTSLASVDASSTNGPREMDNPYYGVLNAFDDGENWIENINYTYWLPSHESVPYIDVHFDQPVTVSRIEVTAAAGTVCAARLKHADGGETLLPSARVPAPPPLAEGTHREGLGDDSDSAGALDPTSLGSQDSPRTPASLAHSASRLPSIARFSSTATGSIELAQPATLVRSMRIEFTLMDAEQPESRPALRSLHEVRVLGFPPEGVSYDVRKPRVLASKRNALLSGKAALDEWRNSLFEGLTPEVVERDDSFVVTYSKSAESGRSGKPIFRISISKATGEGTEEPLVAGW